MIKYLAFLLILFSLGVSAQTLTETDIIGTYRITQCMQPAQKGGEKPINYNAAIEQAKVDRAMADLRRNNPGYTKKDSIKVVNDISLLFVSFAPLRYTYKADGVMELSTEILGGKGKPVTSKWTFNVDTQKITLTYDYDKKNPLTVQVQIREGVIYLVQKSSDGTFIEFVKE